MVNADTTATGASSSNADHDSSLLLSQSPMQEPPRPTATVMPVTPIDDIDALPSQIATVPQIDELWYKDAIIYQVHVRSFADSNGDGIGDFRGLIGKLDYIQSLGVNAIWVMPFYPSPLKDDGYDIADYRDINPMYGTLRDFRVFLREAHSRGLRVITELVFNHTSDQHAWFQRARRAPKKSVARNYYVWSDTDQKYQDARIIFKDFEPSNWTWDAEANAYFWHRFYRSQPDLNFDNPRVREEMLRIIDYWADMGVDGFRLDAIPYLYEREGTNCENVPETHGFLKELRAHIVKKYGVRMLLAEANQPLDDVVAYFGNDDECHMCYNFPIMPRLYMSLARQDCTALKEVMANIPALPPMSQWAVFLRNHDELTLEMVTEEERQEMWRIYAANPRARINMGIRRRLAPLLSNDRRSIELMNGLLFSLPGTPVLYYGDEIGMGDNMWLNDRNGCRTPMQWSAERNAGFSQAESQQLYLPVIADGPYHYQAVNVAAQRAIDGSLFEWTRRIIALRKQHPVFGRGAVRLLETNNKSMLAYVRSDASEHILVVANFSASPQVVELDLSSMQGHTPIDVFGGARFPTIDEGSYRLSIGGRDFFWLKIESAASLDT